MAEARSVAPLPTSRSRSGTKPEDGGDDAMRGLFIALMIMGSIWTGGLVWSIFGGLVLVPSSAMSLGAPKIAPVTNAPQSPTQQLTQTKPSTSASAKPGAG